MCFSLPVCDNRSEPGLDVVKPYASSLGESYMYMHRTVCEPEARSTILTTVGARCTNARLYTLQIEVGLICLKLHTL